MPVYEYRAVDSGGRTVGGTLLSPSLTEAAQSLAGQGLRVEHLGLASMPGDPLSEPFPGQPRPTRPDAASPSSADGPEGGSAPPIGPRSPVVTQVVGPLVLKVNLASLQFFFRQLAAMLNAGVGMVQSLDTLSNQTRDPRLRKVIRELREHALAGRPISVGMQRYPEMFSPMMLSLIRVGETSGTLERCLRQLADYIEQEIEIRNLLRRVTFYPKLVVVASIFIVGGAQLVIGALGKTTNLTSPLTQIGTWLVLAPIIVGVFLFLRVGLANPRVKYLWDAFLLGIPFVGGTVRQLTMARFGRAFGVMYAGGVSMPDAVRLAADACGNEYLRARIYPAADRLKEGRGVTETFRETGAFSPIVLDMTHTGETTGNLDHMLTKMSEFYEDEGKTRSVQLGHVFGVVVYLAVAAYVGFVVISFYQGYLGGLSGLME
ncbi:MAG: type II secretion system F family protein [Fimbriimonadaceae bacterium]